MANTGRPQGHSSSETKGATGGHTGATSGQGMTQKAQDVVGGVTQKAQEMAGAAAERAGQAVSTVGQQMTALAGTIRERAPQEGMMGTAAGTVADTLQAGGRYLQEHGLEDMTGEVANLVRRYPVQCVLAGFGFGFLLGAAFSRR